MDGETQMSEEKTSEWLVEIFIQYQEEISKYESQMRLKEALELDQKNKPSVRNTAAHLDAG